MNVRQLAMQNIRGNWRSYKVFFLSSCFAIFASYIYMSVIFHPYMQRNMWYQNVQWGLIVCNIIVICFFILFILYSNSIFIQTRKKELGLYMLMGATMSNLIGMIIAEQMVMGLLANVFGVGIGMVFLKLFFMIFGMILKFPQELPLIFDIRAVMITVGTYSIIFFVLSFISALRIWNIKVIRLLKEFRMGKSELKSSKWLCLLGFVCLGIGYGLASQATMMTIAIYFIPVVILVSFGTYFSFTHGIIQILQMIKSSKKIMYRYPYLFIVNQLFHRMKENGRFFFLLSMATTVVVTATGAVYLYFSSMQDMWRGGGAHAFSYVEKGVHSSEVMEKGTVENLFHKYGIQKFRYTTFVGLPATFQSNNREDTQATIIGASEYNKEAREQGQKTFHPKIETVTLVYYDKYDGPALYDNKKISLHVLGQTIDYKFNGQKGGTLFNNHSSQINGMFFIMNDKDFMNLAGQISDSEKYVYRGYTLDNIENTEKLNEDLRKHIKQNSSGAFRNNMELYMKMKEGGDITLFIGSFISILFFLTSCSIVYFKWFHDIAYDRKQYHALQKIGMTKREAYKITRWQLGILFFSPILVGSMHSAVALYTFHRIIFIEDSFQKVCFVILFYLLACAIYFFFAQKEYMKHID
ncbi:ABC transporter permease [Bacillus sp. DX1.1]|uniref:ABC transporter permease n=1 Tax=unclassified Bacillus (in: firmicutes) TaxID=185979 RepID=UPI002571041C|nr:MULTISPECIES: ABC transporter permease [unclassified Bacillus (in: firmicutes)]MDM5156628.1 ABC transporter permease [Bacillus sp. DX1.1]WJE80885.1 ABC transporter permease [Bacillus sp. DX3.1]